MIKIILGALAYILPSMPWGYFWHLSVFKKQYDKWQYFPAGRSVPLAFIAMVIQGTILSVAYATLANRTCFSCKHLYLRISYGHFLLEQGCSSLNGATSHHTKAGILFPGNSVSYWSICTVWCLSLRGVLVCISTEELYILCKL